MTRSYTFLILLYLCHNALYVVSAQRYDVSTSDGGEDVRDQLSSKSLDTMLLDKNATSPCSEVIGSENPCGTAHAFLAPIAIANPPNNATNVQPANSRQQRLLTLTEEELKEESAMDAIMNEAMVYQERIVDAYYFPLKAANLAISRKMSASALRERARAVDTTNVTDTNTFGVQVHWVSSSERLATITIDVDEDALLPTLPLNLDCHLRLDDVDVTGFGAQYGNDIRQLGSSDDSLQLDAFDLDPRNEYYVECAAENIDVDEDELLTELNEFGPFSSTFVCGSGALFESSAERCDDGNIVPGDGCDDLCRVEPYWVCRNGTMTTPSLCAETLAVVTMTFSLSLSFADGEVPDVDGDDGPDPSFLLALRTAFADALTIDPDTVWITLTLKSSSSSRRRLDTRLTLKADVRIDCDEGMDPAEIRTAASRARAVKTDFIAALVAYPEYANSAPAAYVLDLPAADLRESPGTCTCSLRGCRHWYWTDTATHPTPCGDIFSVGECNENWACKFVFAPYHVLRNGTKTDLCPPTTYPSLEPAQVTFGEKCGCPAGQELVDGVCTGPRCQCKGEGCRHSFWCQDDQASAWNGSEFTEDEEYKGTGCLSDLQDGYVRCGHTCRNHCTKVPNRDLCNEKWACEWVDINGSNVLYNWAI